MSIALKKEGAARRIVVLSIVGLEPELKVSWLGSIWSVNVSRVLKHGYYT